MRKVVREKTVLKGNSQGRYCAEDCEVPLETLKQVRVHVKKTGHHVYQMKQVIIRWRREDGE